MPCLDFIPFSGREGKAVIDAATEVFARYGFARVTMADLAKAAGLYRTALYSSFANKAEVFDAVVRNHAAATIVAVREGIGQHGTLEDKLGFACERMIVDGFEFVRAMPDARDLFDLEVPAVRDIYIAIQALLIEILVPFANNCNVDLHLLAHRVHHSAHSRKSQLTSKI